jgi:DNA polymerase-3 subunit alpha
MKDGGEVKIAGVPVSVNEIMTRRGERMAFVTLEDLKGSIEIILFAELYKKVSTIVKGERPVMIKGKISVDENNQKVKIRAEEVLPLSDAISMIPGKIHFNLDVTHVSKPQLEKFKNILKNHPGKCDAYLHLFIPGQSETVIVLPDDFRLDSCDALFQEVEYLFGRQVATIN